MTRHLIFPLAITLVALAGCQTCRRLDFTSNRPCCNGCGDAGVVRLNPVPAPGPAPAPVPRQPPIAQIEGPQPATYFEPAPRNTPPNDEQPPTPATPGEEPPVDSPPAILKPPVPLRRDSARAPMPYADEPPTAKPPTANVPSPKSEESRDEEPEDDTARLLNIRPAIRNVRSGLKPFGTDDVAWLKKKGYRAVLQLHAPGANLAADKKAYEKNGPRYLSLEVAPDTLDRATFEEFVAVVEDTKNHPLYVYDDGGTVAGGLWYLYFRFHKGESDADARAKAKQLGLDFDDEGDAHTKMKLAIQKFIADYKR
jgi:hypothetical protein